MRRRSILQWVTLSAVFVVAVFMWARLFSHDSAHATTFQTLRNTQGALRVVGDQGKLSDDCPLKHTAVKAEVSGFITRVTVTQDFENPFPNKIEAVYIFPLPPAAAIDDLTMQIGERTIEGKIMLREEALTAYSNAKQLGKVAALLDQERPNIFTQQVANILPGQAIRVVISYVETLKYEDGFYEWSFPMVVAPRYSSDPNSDAAQLSPPVVEGARAGHDISLDLDLNTGVPILGVNSETHETDVEVVNERRARVQLKDRATIPNKDFVLKYRVAGSSVNDAVLTHRSERGGYFTLILQPPQRVNPADVMPKELVFVIDTSGSMGGFPVAKATETARLALDTLNPHDTFNVITFSGDTNILFSEPVPATPENLRQAKKFLAGHQGSGGTEMMKAIKTALEPSDSQHHVRIVCFMTDGQVGADAEIIAEVQKHKNARVFAMGFGSSPNRYLLDKMAEYGRGEVDYISEQGDTSAVARRFNERIRNPLLTDIAVDWSGIPVTEVFPKRIPDLFSVRPVTLSGRYERGAQGTIRLKGKMAGEDFVRDIPIVLPETENDNDVLATLWARRKIDDIAHAEVVNPTPEWAFEQKREISAIGLRFKLMTQYTSFVAVDDVMFTGTDGSQTVPVPVEAYPGTINSGVAGLVTVTASSSAPVMCNTGVQTSTSDMVKNLPIQGRTFTTYLDLMPGNAVSGSAPRSNSHNTNFQIDGVSANFAIAPGGESPDQTASGSLPAQTASGAPNGIVTLDAIEEIRLRTYSVEAEHGGTSGSQVEITTRGGINNFHGSAFHFFGNDQFDAGDWLANSRRLPKPPKRLNMFGGTFSGPIYRDHAFFFASYEGMRLRQPVVGVTDVPSLAARNAAPSTIRPFLDAFALPNGPTRPDGFAEFASGFANPAAHDVGSIQLIHNPHPTLSLRGRYSFANSDATQRGADRLSLNTVRQLSAHAQSATGWVLYSATPTLVFELHGNYSRLRVDGSYSLDQFGGATIPFASAPGSFNFDLNSRSAGWMTGSETASVQRQFHFSSAATKLLRDHTFRFGGEYRRLSPTIGVRTSQQGLLFDGVAQAIDGVAGRFSSLNHNGSQQPVFESASLFAQDQWRVTPDFTLNYGMRWEVAPAPSTDGQRAFAVDQVSDPSTLTLAAPGTSLWRTTFGNFAPRVGVAYQVANRNTAVLLRSGFGILYDLGHGRAGNIFANSTPLLSGSAVFNAPLPVVLPAVADSRNLPFLAFDPQLELPYTLNWNVAVETLFGSRQRLTASYVGSTGRRLLHTETLFDQNPDFNFLRLTTNRGRSDYRALQLMFHRTVSSDLEAMVSYTWSRSMDNLASDNERRVLMTSFNPDLDRGPSDFDARHRLTGFVSYALPALKPDGATNKLSRNWIINSIFNARSASPLNVLQMFPTSFGVALLRPDLVEGVPAFVLDPAAPGGRRINPEAFRAAAGSEPGSSPRNGLRGFPLYQVDIGLNRKFNFTEAFALQVEADAFNVFNHPNFADPLGNDLVIGSSFGSSGTLTPNLAFGQSTSLSGRNLSSGGFASFYGSGGARTMRFSVKLIF